MLKKVQCDRCDDVLTLEEGDNLVIFKHVGLEHPDVPSSIAFNFTPIEDEDVDSQEVPSERSGTDSEDLQPLEERSVSGSDVHEDDADSETQEG